MGLLSGTYSDGVKRVASSKMAYLINVSKSLPKKYEWKIEPVLICFQL